MRRSWHALVAAAGAWLATASPSLSGPTCANVETKTDQTGGHLIKQLKNLTDAACCEQCASMAQCGASITDPGNHDCYLVSGATGRKTRGNRNAIFLKPFPTPKPTASPNPCSACRAKVEAWGDGAFRVRVAAEGHDVADGLPSALMPHPAATPLAVTPGASVVNGNLRVTAGADGLHTFTRVSDGALLLREVRRSLGDGSALPTTMGVAFEFASTELYGFGQNRAGYNTPDLGRVLPPQAGKTRKLVLAGGEGSSDNTLPWIIGATQNSTTDFGFWLNMPGMGDVTFTQAGGGANASMAWDMAAARQLDFLVATWAAASPAEERGHELLNHFVDWVGHAPPLPAHAAGYWHSKNRYASQQELLDVAHGFANRSVPVDVIIIDWHHWKTLGDWSFDEEAWPDPSAMVKELGELGMEVMVSFWPFSDPGSRSYDTLVKNKWATRKISNDSEFVPTHGGVLVDATIPEARQYVWSLAKSGYYDHGIKIFWLDGSEPEGFINAFGNAWPDSQWQAGTMGEIGQMYDWYWPQAFHDGLKSEGEKDIIMLPRAGYAGSWRFGAAIWSGDTGSNFGVLKTLVQTGLSAQISGIPWWTTDVGGYGGGNPDDPTYREVIVRWFQYGMTCPLFRQHGARKETAIWAYGAEDEKILGDIIRLRASLKGYVLQEMQKTSDTGRPLNRPLWWDYPTDPQAWGLDDEYMFGDSYLAAPVLEMGARWRNVYLPAGSWVHHYTSKAYAGGRTYNVSAPLDSFPLFKKA